MVGSQYLAAYLTEISGVPTVHCDPEFSQTIRDCSKIYGAHIGWRLSQACVRSKDLGSQITVTGECRQEDPIDVLASSGSGG